MDCGDPPAPTNGTVLTPGGTTVDNIAMYSCDPGFIISYPGPRVCLSTGSWSGPEPTCDSIGKRKYILCFVVDLGLYIYSPNRNYVRSGIWLGQIGILIWTIISSSRGLFFSQVISQLCVLYIAINEYHFNEVVRLNLSVLPIQLMIPDILSVEKIFLVQGYKMNSFNSLSFKNLKLIQCIKVYLLHTKQCPMLLTAMH